MKEGLASPVPPVRPVSDKRIVRLLTRRESLLRALFAPGLDASENAQRAAMEEFEACVVELASLKARRNALPVEPYTVTLDEHASRLVRSIMLDEPGLSIEDVVNGCVYFNADDDHDSSPDCFEAARAARLGKESA